MKKYIVVNGKTDVWNDEFDSLEDAKQEVNIIYDGLNKYDKKDLKRGEYYLYIDIVEGSRLSEEKLEEKIAEDMDGYNSAGFKIVDTLGYKEVLVTELDEMIEDLKDNNILKQLEELGGIDIDNIDDLDLVMEALEAMGYDVTIEDRVGESYLVLV